MRTTVNEFLQENDPDKIMGLDFKTYQELIQSKMGDVTLDGDFLSYGRFGRIEFNVVKFNIREPKYCINSSLLKICKGCSDCR